MDRKSGKLSQIAYPCAGCKTLRRKCGEKCLLAPYFPPDNPQKFLIPHKIFGTRNILNILQAKFRYFLSQEDFNPTDVEAEKREDAVNSIVYEATCRLLDPVYGCTGVVCQLQKRVSELQSQLATTQAELLEAQVNLASFDVGFCCTEKGGGNAFDMTHFMLEENLKHEDHADPILPLWT